MSRLFGSLAGEVTSAELAAAASRQAHGGRDGRGVLRGPGWSLGCNRLAVTETAHGGQPYRSPQVPGVVAALDGELYNHRELRRRLRARGYVFPDRSDSSLLPALYAEYGLGFARHLDGMFAVAVIDLRTEPSLVLATDEHGMKTLYCHTAPSGAVRFASELSALLAFSQVPAERRDAGLDEYLTNGACLGNRTLLEGIRVLPPATTASATGRHGLVVRRRAERAPEPAPHPDGPDGATPLQREIVRLTQTDAPVCAVMTEGTDSQLVTALAARQLRETGAPPLHTFHVSYRGRRPGARQGSARAAARRSGTTHHEIALGGVELADLLPRTVWHLGQPNADPAALSMYALFREVRGAGFTVALSGEGGREIFAGQPRFGRAEQGPRGHDWVAPYVDAVAAVPRWLRESLYAQDYRAHLRAQGSEADRLATSLRATVGGRPETLADFETRYRLPAHRLRPVDHLSAAWAVEARMPYLRSGVLAYARRIRTGDAPAGPAGPRPDPRPEGLTPAQMLLAPGTPLLQLAYDTLSSEQPYDGRLDPAAVRRLLADQVRASTPEGASAVWALLVHELWSQELRVIGSAEPLVLLPAEPALAA
ncbi:asparagine synthetase B family protein [Streptomyces sp. NPDC057418]|uniref:asparagine synthetase B family protein n=1 Tax=unclassified Streptomyces TaxID=2593676 RepID=UPI0036755149